ncbi:MAG: glucosylglycerol-phosphate synthase, partial [Myxococcales bacterium]|nr:glucosylglycerol-phosphate synthase [Myxococcales bacterium]
CQLERLDAPIFLERAASTIGSDSDPQLVMVYHRLPFDEVRRGARTLRRRPKSPNGVIPSLLGFFANGRDGSWVAWSLQPSRRPNGFEAEVDVDAEHYPSLVASRIPLTRDDVNLFYKRFSKEAFWPIIFSFPERALFDHQHWDHYLTINRLFAERAAQVAKPGALVWIHDYNLWMVPAFLRRLRPDVRIAFFHHTAFPPADIFNIIPWRREILGSLTHCDYVAFHIPRYVENFAEALRSFAPTKTLASVNCAPRFLTYGCALGVDRMTTRIAVDGRELRMGAHPVGIDVARIERLLSEDSVRDAILAMRRRLGSRRCILSIERLDYVKGPLEKLAAYEMLLESHSELHGTVELLNVITPPAPGMEAYRSLRGRVDEAVGRINGRFGTLDWTPVRYFYRSLPFDEVVAHYAVADVAWITPLRDGLNLVAKEFVAANSKVNGRGVLVLSEFAGAATELHGAILTNPFDIRQMCHDLHRALRTPVAERQERLRRMAAIIGENDIERWGTEFLRVAAG